MNRRKASRANARRRTRAGSARDRRGLRADAPPSAGQIPGVPGIADAVAAAAADDQRHADPLSGIRHACARRRAAHAQERRSAVDLARRCDSNRASRSRRPSRCRTRNGRRFTQSTRRRFRRSIRDSAATRRWESPTATARVRRSAASQSPRRALWPHRRSDRRRPRSAYIAQHDRAASRPRSPSRS